MKMKVDILRYLDFASSRIKAIHVVLGLLTLFLILTAIVLLLPPRLIDIEFSEEVQEVHNPLLDFLMKAISWFGSRTVSISLTLGTSLVFLAIGFRKEAFFLALTLLASVINFGIKLLVNRPRPTDDAVRILVEAQHQSFPSGHTVFYVTFFGLLLFLMYRLRNLPTSLRISIGLISLTLVLAVPFSRVYLGAHWFSDVLAGFILGLLFLTILIHYYLKPSNNPGE